MWPLSAAERPGSQTAETRVRSRLTAEPLLSGKTMKAKFTPPARDLSSPGSWVSSQGLCSALLGVD